MENDASYANDRVMSVQDWALTIFIASLPVIGFIMMLVWAFDSGTNIHKKNWAKGNLLIMVLVLILTMLFLFAFGGLAILASLGS